MKDFRKRYIKKLFKVGWHEFSTEGFFLNGFQGEGEYKVWYDNGQLYAHASYKNGKLDGDVKTWHNDGQLYAHASYKNGKLDGDVKKWDFNGQLQDHKLYKDGEVMKDYLK